MCIAAVSVWRKGGIILMRFPVEKGRHRKSSLNILFLISLDFFAATLNNLGNYSGWVRILVPGTSCAFGFLLGTHLGTAPCSTPPSIPGTSYWLHTLSTGGLAPHGTATVQCWFFCQALLREQRNSADLNLFIWSNVEHVTSLTSVQNEGFPTDWLQSF